MLGKPPDTLAPGLVKMYFWIVILIFTHIRRVQSLVRIHVLQVDVLGSHKFPTQIKDALHIEWERPALNKQLKHLHLVFTISVPCFPFHHTVCCNPWVLHNIFTVLYSFQVFCNSLFRCTRLVLQYFHRFVSDRVDCNIIFISFYT